MTYIVLAAAAIVSLFPFYFMFVSATNSNADILTAAPKLISVVTSLLLILLPRVFMNMMTNHPQLQAIGAVYVFVMGFIQIPQNLSRIYNGTLRALGCKNTPMLVAGFGIWIVRIPLCLLAAYVLRLPLVSVWIVIAVDQLSRFMLSVCLYRRVCRKRSAGVDFVRACETGTE